MESVQTATNPREGDREMTAQQALRKAWGIWLAMLLIPFVVFIALLWSLLWGELQPEGRLAVGFFWASMVWLLFAVPGAFILRNNMFKAYWNGETVDPTTYLRGMITIWLAPEIGGLLALIGCWISGTLLPGLFPAAIAFMLFTPFWPTGRAMSDPVGQADDDEIFRHPR